MEHSASLVNLSAALAKAQADMENAAKSSNNPFFGSKYADLAEIIDTARPVLGKHGLSVVQLPGFEGERVTLENILLHESGEWISGVSAAPMPVMTKRDGTVLPPSPQGVGSAITYLRRYSLAAMCLIAQEDDDGNTASHPAKAHEERPTPEQRKMYEKPAPPSEPNGVKHHSGGFDLSEVVAFGKHKGRAWAELVEEEPDYVEWAIAKMDKLSPATKQLLSAALSLHGTAVGRAIDRATDTPLNEPEPDGLPF